MAVTGVGEELARARRAQGLEVADVAQQLKFAPRQIEALEQERFDLLPGATFARGMLKTYARLLKLDAAPLIERVAERLQLPDASRLEARYTQMTPFSEGGRRSNIVYLTLSVVILGAVAAVAYEWHQERNAPERLAFVAPVKPASAPAAPVEPPAGEQPPAEMKSAEAVPAVEPVEVKPAAEEVGGSKALAPHRFVFRFQGDSWVEVRDGAGRVLIAQLAPDGSERVVQGRQPPFSLVIGNAAGVSLSYNEKPVDLKKFTKVDVARFTLP